MGIKFARIDDRLIHGQVTTTWIKNYEIEQVIILNDEIANDQIQCSVMQLAAPAGVKVHLFQIDKFIDIYKKTLINKSTMLIFTNPFDVLRTIEGGVKIPFINLGGMKYKSGKTQLTKAVSLDEEDKKEFREIKRKGVEVIIQMVPSDKRTRIEELLK